MESSTTTVNAASDTASVTVKVAATQARAYTALTEPSLVREWFGALSAPLVTGASATLDFGDGDFFAITDVVARPPASLTYRWRFLGTSPVDEISWKINASDDGATVAVRDRDPLRDPASNEMLEEGWRDFTDRLVTFLATGRNARYDWRRDFDGAILLQAAARDAEALLAARAAEWLPIDGSGLSAGSRLRVNDGLQPETAAITNVRPKSPGGVLFTLSSDAWLHPTHCQIDIHARPPGILLSVAQSGWEKIAHDATDQKKQRRRFAAMWVASLKRAAALVEV